MADGTSAPSVGGRGESHVVSADGTSAHILGGRCEGAGSDGVSDVPTPKVNGPDTKRVGCQPQISTWLLDSAYWQLMPDTTVSENI